MTCQKLVWSQKCLVQKMFGQKQFCSKNVLGPKKSQSLKKFGLKKFDSFKIIAHRFLIKTNVGKILGAERFGSKEVVVAFMLELSKIISGPYFDPKNLKSKTIWVKMLVQKSLDP